MATYAGQATLHCNTGTNTSAHVHRVEAINQPHLTSGGPSSESDRPFELAAGDTIDLHAESRAYSGAPQNSELRVWLLVYEDNTGVEAMPLTLVMDIASFEVGQQYRGSTTFTAPESGTYRVTLRARYDDDGSSVAGGYDGNTDGSWSRQGSTPLWTNQPTWHQGYVRSGVTINAVNPDNDIAFDGPPSPFAWPDTVRLQVQASHGIVTNTSNSNLNFNTTDGNGDPVLSGTVAMNDTTIWQDNGGTSQLDSSHPTSFGLNFKPADSTLSGRPTVHFEGVPASWVLGATDGGAQTTKSVEISRDTYLSWNGSINVDHHLQVNDNVFDQSSSQINRLISDLGFVTFTLTNARGELTSGVTCDELSLIHI